MIHARHVRFECFIGVCVLFGLANDTFAQIGSTGGGRIIVIAGSRDASISVVPDNGSTGILSPSNGGSIFLVIAGPGGIPIIDRASESNSVEPVSKVTTVEGSLDNGKVLITAKGIVPTTGWSNATLSPVMYVVPPADGIFAYQFVATRPGGFVNQVETIIETAPSSIEHLRKMKGIRVEAATNAMVLRLLQYAPEGYPEPVDKFDMKDVAVIDGMLQVSVQYVGGVVARHDFELFWDGTYLESNPPQVKMRLIHNGNDDPGEAILLEQLRFALPALDPCIIHIEDGLGNVKDVRIGLE